MINWQNRQHKIIIISSAVILLIAIIFLLFFFFNKKTTDLPKNENQPTNNEQTKNYSVPESIKEWREKETARLTKAEHDTALYQEIKNSKNADRCQEMQGLNGKNICLLSLASDLQDEKICEKISDQEFLFACQEKFKK